MNGVQTCALPICFPVTISQGKKGQEDITVVKKIAYYNAPNAIIQDKALDKAYKLRGSYAAEKKDVNVKGLFSLSELASGDFYEEED